MEDSFYPFIDFLADTNIDITEDSFADECESIDEIFTE